MKKLVSLFVLSAMLLMMLAGCAGDTSSASSTASTASTSSEASSEASEESSEAASSEATANTNPIVVNSREDGSGTRGAFVELFGIEQEDESGEKVDMTIATAEITNSTSVMMTSVAGNPDAIGYISLGSLNETVKAVSIDGVAPSVDTVKDGTYPIARPFNIATNGDVSEAAQDFINFIMSAEGQAIVEEEGYIPMDDVTAFEGGSASGDVVVAGSSSVTPVMEVLKEAYNAINPNVNIEVQQSDSTTGMNNAIEGVCDIGMASRELKDSELEAGLTPTVIAMDGIAVIVNLENGIDNLTSEQVKGIYTGELTSWADVQ